MGSIEVFDHTADVGLRIRGDDLADLFRTAAGGLVDYVVANRGAVRVDRVDAVSLRADSTAELLLAWLDELIFLIETRHVLYARFEVDLSDDGLALEARLGGEAIDPGRHVLDHEVKAVTRHGATFGREGSGWVAEVILDI